MTSAPEEEEPVQIVRIFTSVKPAPLVDAHRPPHKDKETKAPPKQISSHQTQPGSGSDEVALIARANSVFADYENAKLKLKKTIDFLHGYASNTMAIDLNSVLQYKNDKETILKEKQKESSDLYSTINKILTGKKAILEFFKSDTSAFEPQIKKIEQDITEFTNLLKKLALISGLGA